MPDFEAYHRSITEELRSLRNRIRDLVPHWPTDGEYKETALRALLRRYLPDGLLVGRGFIVTHEVASTQLDILIIDGSQPTLFRDGDLFIVTPDVVRAVIEVKTRLGAGDERLQVMRKLADVGALCRTVTSSDRVWLGLFAYEANHEWHEELLAAVRSASRTADSPINCVAHGNRTFIRHWTRQELAIDRNLDGPDHPGNNALWKSYDLRDLTPSYFLGNLIHALSASTMPSHFAWFPLRTGKEAHARYEIEWNGDAPYRL